MNKHITICVFCDQEVTRDQPLTDLLGAGEEVKIDHAHDECYQLVLQGVLQGAQQRLDAAEDLCIKLIRAGVGPLTSAHADQLFLDAVENLQYTKQRVFFGYF